MKLVITFLIAISACTAFAQQSKKQVTKNIEAWYDQYPEKYSLSIHGKEASATVTRYHPERADEKNDLIEISFEGMGLTLKFDQPLDQITAHKDSLQKHFSYVSLSNIYSEIPSKGWNIHPEAPQSAMRGKGVKFTSSGDSLSLSINWSIYTVMGYKDSDKCDEERSVADGTVGKACYVAVNKRIRLEILIVGVPIDSL